jgi:hypothetical protein|tara:strand:+ start:3827 stop:4387 length:561 start_codon:yes stop_codon:yes gene_type:complete
MACALTNGRALECREAVGGLRNVYFANHDTLGAYTISDGELTAVDTAAADVFKYALNPQSSEYSETITVSEDNGTVFYEQVTTLMLPNLSKAALSALRLLTSGRFQIFTEDNNVNESNGFGVLYLVGAYNGATVTGGTVALGKALGDMSGYTLTITSRERKSALIVEAGTTTIFDGISAAITVVTS